MELELKTEEQTNYDYNTFFYATMCHVCKRFGDDVPLMRCSRCKLISYCGPQHQKQHWAQHKRLCKAIRDVPKDDSVRFDKNLTRDFMLDLIEAVEKKKGSLEMYERQMFLFPKECAVCHDPNSESLVDCQNCATSFCKNHKDDIAHKDACAPLELCLRINLTLNKLPSITRMFLQLISNTEMSNTFQDMNDFIKDYGNIQEVHSEIPYDVLAACISERLTCCLTLLHVMKLLNYLKRKVVIHVVAASDIDEYTLKMWEILLHLIPETKVSLMIVIIRSELNNESFSLSVCDNCLSRGKKISFEFYDGLYEDYVRSPSFLKPDFAVGFNANIQEDDTHVAEITMLSIKMLAKQNCPFLLTNYTQETLEKSVNRMNTILNGKVDLVFSGKNPFASLRPYRFIGRDLVLYFNNFVAIYRSLCS